jgi:heterodisulfide reductase subunit C
MDFKTLLYISLILFLLGLTYKIGGWFVRKIGILAAGISSADRLRKGAAGLAGVIFSTRLLTLLKTLLLDILLQRKIFRQSLLRWIMHMSICWGFLLLLPVHALDSLLMEPFVSDYQSTRNPFLFLRDLFGFFVLMGLGIAVYRRFIGKVPRLMTSKMDIYAISILAAIIFSGIFLEGLKLSSYGEFEMMVKDYSGIVDESEREALESLWVQEFGLVSPNVQGPFLPDILEQGREVHEMSCMECHASAKWAFASYAAAKAISPVALSLEQNSGIQMLWYVHFLACFLGLAYLPFSKMFHIVATPLSYIANAVMDEKQSSRANRVTRQILELDACTHCGTCSLSCSAMMASEATGNAWILPSEKMAALKQLAVGKALSLKALEAVRQGVSMCTNCDRCTVVCPSGIRLRELWVSVGADLLQTGDPEPLLLSPFSLYRGLSRKNGGPSDYRKPLERAYEAVRGDFEVLSDPVSLLVLGEGNEKPSPKIDPTFLFCFGCQNCTTACPVVGNYEKPQEILGLLPHQIMYALALGRADLASGARMIWDCVTCYQCQEQCPQKVDVTELFFELKNQAVDRLQRQKANIPA